MSGEVGTARAVLRYEWRCLVSLRGGLVLLAAALLSASSTVVTASSLAPAARYLRGAVPFAETVVYAPMGFLAVLLYIVGAMSLGHDYRYRRALVLHVAVPRRTRSYAAKLAFAITVGTTGALVAVAAGAIGVWLNGDATVLRPAGGLSAAVLIAVRCWCAAAFYVVAAFSTTALTGSFMWGLLTPVLASSVVESVLQIVMSDRMPWLSYVLPFSAVRHTLGLGTGAGAPGGPAAQYGIVLAWALVLAVAGGYRYVRREW